MSVKKNKKTGEKQARFKRISMLCGVVGVVVALVSILFWIISGLTHEECVFVEKPTKKTETKMVMCEYENGNVVSDVFEKMHVIFYFLSVFGPIVGFVFGVISMIKREKYGWNGLVLNLIFFYIVAIIVSIPTFWFAGGFFSNDAMSERVLTD